MVPVATALVIPEMLGSATTARPSSAATPEPVMVAGMGMVAGMVNEPSAFLIRDGPPALKLMTTG